MMDKNFKGIIWTNHALERLQERGIRQQDAWMTFTHPDSERFAATEGGWVYYKTYGAEKIEVVAKQNERKEWVILSVWSRPIYGGNTNYKSSSKNLPLLDRIVEKVLQKLFGRFQRKR